MRCVSSQEIGITRVVKSGHMWPHCGRQLLQVVNARADIILHGHRQEGTTLDRAATWADLAGWTLPSKRRDLGLPINSI